MHSGHLDCIGCGGLGCYATDAGPDPDYEECERCFGEGAALCECGELATEEMGGEQFCGPCASAAEEAA